MYSKYQILKIEIKGKGSTKVNQSTNCLKSFRKTIADNNNVTVGKVVLTYVEKEACPTN